MDTQMQELREMAQKVYSEQSDASRIKWPKSFKESIAKGFSKGGIGRIMCIFCQIVMYRSLQHQG